MAKQKGSSIDTAGQELAKANREYDALVRRPRAGMTVEQRYENFEACKKALAAKRQARIVLDALKHNRPAPAANEAVETKALDE